MVRKSPEPLLTGSVTWGYRERSAGEDFPEYDRLQNVMVGSIYGAATGKERRRIALEALELVDLTRRK